MLRKKNRTLLARSAEKLRLKRDHPSEQEVEEFLHECYPGMRSKRVASTSLPVEGGKKQGVVTLCKSYLKRQLRGNYKQVNEPAKASIWKISRDPWAAI